jgi:hypothetical protein
MGCSALLFLPVAAAMFVGITKPQSIGTGAYAADPLHAGLDLALFAWAAWLLYRDLQNRM